MKHARGESRPPAMAVAPIGSGLTPAEQFILFLTKGKVRSL